METRRVRARAVHDAVRVGETAEENAELLERLRNASGVTHAWFSVKDHPWSRTFLGWYDNSSEHSKTAEPGEWLIFVGWPEYVETWTHQEIASDWEIVRED